MNRITLHDKQFQLLVPAERIDREIARVAAEINRDLAGESPLFLAILNGAFMFASDLIKQITIPGTEISFVKIASYAGTRSTGQVNQLIGLNEPVRDRTVVLLEDLVDTGRSILHLRSALLPLQPRRLLLAAMFYKPHALLHDVHPDYACLPLDDDFIVGRGLDYNGLGRNLPDLYQIIDNE